MNLIKKHINCNLTKLNRVGMELWITIHYTAGGTSKPGAAVNTAAWFGNPSAKASADYVVDDAYVVELNPDILHNYTWHCGGKKYNTHGGSLYGKVGLKNTIGIEVCSSNTNSSIKGINANDPSWYYTNAAIENTLELVKYLMDKYNVPADHVIRHYDVNGKPCPGIVGWNADTGDETKWLAFKARLEDDIVTQDQFNKMMDTYLAQQAAMPATWEDEIMKRAVKDGIVQGDELGQTMAKKFLTRGEMLTVLYRLFDKKR